MYSRGLKVWYRQDWITKEDRAAADPTVLANFDGVCVFRASKSIPHFCVQRMTCAAFKLCFCYWRTVSMQVEHIPLGLRDTWRVELDIGSKHCVIPNLYEVAIQEYTAKVHVDSTAKDDVVALQLNSR